MKTIKLLLLALCISVAGYAQTNLLTNGDFETASYLTGTYPGTAFTLTGWSFSYGKDFYNETGFVIGGTQTLRMGGGTSDGGQIYQLINVTAGTTYRFGFTARTMDVAGASGTGSSTGKLYANVYQGNNSTAPYLIKGATTVNSVTNTAQSIEFTVPAAVTQVRVNFYKDKFLVYLDDAYLYQLSASTIDVRGANSYFYTGSPQGPSTCTVTGSTGDVTYSYLGVNGTTYAASATPPTNVGNYTVTATVAGTNTYASATGSMNFTISNLTNGNYVANGDFEATPWSSGLPASWLMPSYGTSTNYTPALSNVIGGTESLLLGNPSTSVDLYQVVALEAGVTYRFGYTARLLDANGPSGGALSLVSGTQPQLWASIKEYVSGTTLISSSVSSGTDASPVVEFTVGSNTLIKVYFYKNYKYVYIDDVFVQKKDVATGIQTSEEKVKINKIGSKSVEVIGTDVEKIKVMNISGVELFKTNPVSAKTTVNLGSYPAGVYLIAVKLKDGGQIVKKEVIQ